MKIVLGRAAILAADPGVPPGSQSLWLASGKGRRGCEFCGIRSGADLGAMGPQGSVPRGPRGSLGKLPVGCGTHEVVRETRTTAGGTHRPTQADGIAEAGMGDGAWRRNLIYIICMDGPGSEGNRFLTKMLVSSLLRTYFTGDIVVFRNSEVPLFLVERKGLEEIYLDTPQVSGKAGAEDAWCWKYKVAPWLDVRGYDKVLYLDADMLALRNIDHLLEGDWDLRYQPERGHRGDESTYNSYYTEEELAAAGLRTGVNSGTLAVRAGLFHQVMDKWREIDEGQRMRTESGFWDQASWNALLYRCAMEKGVGASGPDGWAEGAQGQAGPAPLVGDETGGQDAPPPWAAEAFPVGEVQFPMYLDLDYRRYSLAALTHNCGANTLGKIEFTFGLYMRTFFCDPTGLFFSMLET